MMCSWPIHGEKKDLPNHYTFPADASVDYFLLFIISETLGKPFHKTINWSCPEKIYMTRPLRHFNSFLYSGIRLC